VTSSDVNAYLKITITGKHHGQGFSNMGGHGVGRHAAQAKRNLRTAIENVDSRLGNRDYLPEMLRTSRGAHIISGWQARPGDQVGSRK